MSYFRLPPASEPPLVIAPPPTPNGDLHVGHLAGPYVAADIYRRSRGSSVRFPLHTDDHQSYVATSALRRGVTPETLASESAAAIGETFRAAAVGHDLFERGRGPRYDDFVAGFFRQLVERGRLHVRPFPFLYDQAEERCLVDSWARGRCPNCFAASAGGVCEDCGLPNQAIDLLWPSGGRELTTRQVPALVLSLEPYRAALEAHFGSIQSTLRPTLRRLLYQIFDRPLPDVPITTPGDWGLEASRLGLPEIADQRINAWPELLPGHLFFAEEVGQGWSSDAPAVFLGFDNSFTYLVVHGALLLASGRAIPRHFITNEFYEYQGLKFSTSQCHAVWAREAIDALGADPLRYFLARTGPQYQRGNYEPATARSRIERELLTPLRAVVARAQATLSVKPRSARASQLAAFQRRCQQFYAIEGFDPSAAAASACNLLAVMEELARQGSESPSQPELSVLAGVLAPITPSLSAAIEDDLAAADQRTLPLESTASFLESIPSL